MTSVWEFTDLTFDRTAKRSDVKSYLTLMAEIDRWEIDRVRITSDGKRYVRLRRKIYHVQRSA